MKTRNARPARPRARSARPRATSQHKSASNSNTSQSSPEAAASASPALNGVSAQTTTTTTTANANGSLVQTIHVSPRRRITRALLRGTALTLGDYAEVTNGEAGNVTGQPVDAAASSSISAADASSPTHAVASPVRRVVVVGGVLRCVCNAFLIHAQESLLECSECRNWCHPACVGVDHVELKMLQRQKNFVCPYCTGAIKLGAAEGEKTSNATLSRHDDNNSNSEKGNGSTEAIVTTSGATTSSRSEAEFDGLHHTSMYFGVGRQPPAPRQVPLKLREVPDHLPESRLTAELTGLLHRLRTTAVTMGYDVLDLPDYRLSEAEVGQCVECCAEAVREATFSESYPTYCLKEVRTAHHSYVQGTLLRARDEGVICSLVLSNGMDVYGNLRPTLIQLKSAVNRQLLDPSCITETMRQCLGVTDVSDFVHITLSATHVRFRNRGLAKLLLVFDLVKWALRGRRRAFLNMAIEKHLVQGGTRVAHVTPQASRRLYHSLGFDDVYPRYDPVTRAERWTAREADMGRVMINLDFVPRVGQLGSELVARTLTGDEKADEGTQAPREPRPRVALSRRREGEDAVTPAWSRVEGPIDGRPLTRRALRLYREGGANGSRAQTTAATATRSARTTSAQDETPLAVAAPKRRRLSLTR